MDIGLRWVVGRNLECCQDLGNVRELSGYKLTENLEMSYELLSVTVLMKESFVFTADVLHVTCTFWHNSCRIGILYPSCFYLFICLVLMLLLNFYSPVNISSTQGKIFIKKPLSSENESSLLLEHSLLTVWEIGDLGCW